MAKAKTTQPNPEFQSREINATIGELHRTTCELMDMKDVLQSNITAESIHLGTLSPTGQDLIFALISRLLSKQTEMVQHLQITLGIENIDWDDLHVGKLDAHFDMVSRKNRDEQL